MKYFLSLLFFCLLACNSPKESDATNEEIDPVVEREFYLGADLSYVNEIEDCGANFRSENNLVDPYQLFAEKNCNLVRIRKWHTPDFSPYSNYEDIEKSLQRAKQNAMPLLLDFHYSDTWADPEKQYIPEAWKDITSTTILGDSVYQYTVQTLEKLKAKGLLPEMVQIGNETNNEILQPYGTHAESINWERNAFLLNRGLEAVDDFNLQHQTSIEKMLHIAQPENALWWFAEAHQNGIGNYDWIGLSYYPLWSEYQLDRIAEAIELLKNTYQKKVMIVETAYPYTLENADEANNILSQSALIDGYPATPEGQKQYLLDLTQEVINGGGKGVIYWEPAWVTSDCHTLWGHGSHWDNATFFNAQEQNNALPAFDYYQLENYTFDE